MSEQSIKKAPPPSSPGRDRSPPFPFISLKAALDRLASFEAIFGRHPAPVDKIGLAWKMKEKSSQALQTAAALKAYGLIDYTGKPGERTLAISDDGRTYLRAQQESVKAEVIRRCAMRPKALAMCWNRWGPDRPPEPVCLDQLILKDKFTESAAKTLLRVYDETVAFAKLDVSSKFDEVSPGNSDEDELTPDYGAPAESGTAFKPGEIARRESIGGIAERFAYPHPQLSGSLTPQPPVGAAMKQDTFSLDEGTVVLQWPSQMSETSYEDFKDWIELQLRKIKRSIQ